MDPIDKLSLQWKRNAWLNSTQLYGELTDLCIKDTVFTRLFANLIDNSEVDNFSKVIVNIFTAANRTLPLIKDLIYNEFNSKVSSEGEGSILRGNNIVNKIEGAYVRLIGANYLRFVLSDLVTKVSIDKDLKLEVDPRKLNAYNDEGDGYQAYEKRDPEDELRENIENLNEVSQMFLDRITDPTVIEEMPREIRAIADYTAESALRYAPESLTPLVGGFIMLRFFSPAIVTPEYSKLISSDIVPTNRSRRNLVLLAKVLQNASNGVLFGGKEEFMTCMNDFISRNEKKMSNYFNMICKDPLMPQNKWSDLEGISIPYLNKSGGSASSSSSSTATGSTLSSSGGSSNSSNSSISSISSSNNSSNNSSKSDDKPGVKSKWLVTTPSTYAPGQSPSVNSKNTSSTSTTTTTQKKNMYTASPWDSYIKNIEIQDLFDLHRIFDVYREKIQLKLASGNKTAIRILEILKELGPSPKTKNEKKKRETDASEELTPNGGASLNSAFDDCTYMLERARFLYQGPNDKHDKAVFYLIANRIKPEVFDNYNPLIAHIFKVMDNAVNAPYTLILDMSWAHPPDLKGTLFTHLPKLSQVFARKYKKNVDNIFIIHPSAYTRALVYFLRPFTSRKLKKKIVEVYNWKQLTPYIDIENIALPETSKDFITKSYRVVKVNSKGKRQERLIKFTSNSLLNIDPKTKRIQNEKRIDQIEEISSRLGSTEIYMKFGHAPTSFNTDRPTSGGARLGFLTLKGNSLEANNRKYVCNHELERDHILQDIFETGFKMGLARIAQHQLQRPPLPTEFKVIKVNNAGKHQERIFKLTIDSLLNLDQQSIKSENSFAGIEEVHCDQEVKDVVWIKFKSEAHKRKIICRDNEGKLLHDALTEAINKYQTTIDIQENDLKLEGEIGNKL
ncbi:Ras GTPase activation domain-containing protein [Tieghemostelium lacteum]|uniref:Ras GTPase activation domain-containing protein n=1 Tax=Tieghemostelium lacteum TaxID=361077 RepID=A0A151ZE14_TIELA|nr:Ras GTPase activation domain-containing protein [Tieghemostelium lacteum]|eukprot:KYQ92202.1 Ras GTPase activation domain-containing protein [Tieghemostelium lacteum]